MLFWRFKMGTTSFLDFSLLGHAQAAHEHEDSCRLSDNC